MAETAVVTGAGSGVGRAIALRFAREGWNVGLVSRRTETLTETIALANPDARDRMVPFPCDVSDAAAVEAMGRAVLTNFGNVDVLVNAAGINVRQRSFTALSLDDWHAVLGTNLHGAYYCVRAFLPGMMMNGIGLAPRAFPGGRRKEFDDRRNKHFGLDVVRLAGQLAVYRAWDDPRNLSCRVS